MGQLCMVAANDRTQDNFDWGCYTITKLFYYEIDFLMFLEQKMLQILSSTFSLLTLIKISFDLLSLSSFKALK